jgi:CspA family cold shock protein
MAEDRVTGTVKWFNSTKGYGFIAPDGAEEDVFVHYSAIQSTSSYRTLNEGDRVEFSIEQSPKGPQATNVVKIYGAEEDM